MAFIFQVKFADGGQTNQDAQKTQMNPPNGFIAYAGIPINPSPKNVASMMGKYPYSLDNLDTKKAGIVATFITPKNMNNVFKIGRAVAGNEDDKIIPQTVDKIVAEMKNRGMPADAFELKVNVPRESQPGKNTYKNTRGIESDVNDGIVEKFKGLGVASAAIPLTADRLLSHVSQDNWAGIYDYTSKKGKLQDAKANAIIIPKCDTLGEFKGWLKGLGSLELYMPAVNADAKDKNAPATVKEVYDRMRLITVTPKFSAKMSDDRVVFESNAPGVLQSLEGTRNITAFNKNGETMPGMDNLKIMNGMLADSKGAVVSVARLVEIGGEAYSLGVDGMELLSCVRIVKSNIETRHDLAYDKAVGTVIGLFNTMGKTDEDKEQGIPTIADLWGEKNVDSVIAKINDYFEMPLDAKEEFVIRKLLGFRKDLDNQKSSRQGTVKAIENFCRDLGVGTMEYNTKTLENFVEIANNTKGSVNDALLNRFKAVTTEADEHFKIKLTQIKQENGTPAAIYLPACRPAQEIVKLFDSSGLFGAKNTNAISSYVVDAFRRIDEDKKMEFFISSGLSYNTSDVALKGQ